MNPEDNTSSNRSTYDRIAPAYLQRQLKYAEDGDDLFVDLEHRWGLSMPAVGLVADVGCGPALDGLRFARAGYRVIGIDLSSGMLRIAAEHLPGRVAQGDLRTLPVRPASLAGIWCVAALLHVPEPETPVVLDNLYRGLCPGGVLALVTAIGEGSRFEAVPFAPDEQRWFVYRQPDQLSRQLQDAGFRIGYSRVVEGNRTWLTALAERASP